MITINLLPAEFRIVEKKTIKPPLFKIAMFILILFALLTSYLYVDYLVASSGLEALEKNWSEKQPQFQKLTQLRNEVTSTLQQEMDFMQRFVTTDKPLTFILMWIGKYLPETAWITEFRMEREEGEGKLFLKGLVYPMPERSTIELIEDYLQSIKNEMPDATLSLTTTRQKMEDVTLTQFIANFSWEAVEQL